MAKKADFSSMTAIQVKTPAGTQKTVSGKDKEVARQRKPCRVDFRISDDTYSKLVFLQHHYKFRTTTKLFETIIDLEVQKCQDKYDRWEKLMEEE